jgi:hypothetical protein
VIGRQPRAGMLPPMFRSRAARFDRVLLAHACVAPCARPRRGHRQWRRRTSAHATACCCGRPSRTGTHVARVRTISAAPQRRAHMRRPFQRPNAAPSPAVSDLNSHGIVAAVSGSSLLLASPRARCRCTPMCRAFHVLSPCAHGVQYDAVQRALAS